MVIGGIKARTRLPATYYMATSFRRETGETSQIALEPLPTRHQSIWQTSILSNTLLASFTPYQSLHAPIGVRMRPAAVPMMEGVVDI